VSFGRDSASALEERAALAGMPITLWSTLAVEASRSVALATTSFGLSERVVEEMLASAASVQPDAPRHSRLTDYARALRQARPRDAVGTSGAVALRPSLGSATAWRVAAAESSVSLEEWIGRRVVAPPAEFVTWEATAAEAGRSLPEWALLQAARRLRSASTPAQIAG
jgi:hypothetical protein